MHPVTFVQPAAVKAIALSVNVTHLTDEAAKALAPDVEYRLREVIQDALKFARHSKRTKLTTQDINNALRLRNIEPLYGFLGNNDPSKFVRATGHPDVYFVRDDTIPLEQITCAPLPKAPNQTTVMPHWLFIEGVQPQTEENAAVERPPPPPKRPRLAAGAAAAGGPGAGGAGQGVAGAPGITGQGAQDVAAGRRRDAAAAAGSQQQLQQQQQPQRPPGALGGALAAPDGASTGSGAAGQAAVSVQLPVQHILSDEMQRLLEQIKRVLGPAALPAPPPAAAPGGDGSLWGTVEEVPGGAAGGGPSSGPSYLELTPMQRAVLTTMQLDPGMQQLLPYLTKHVADEVTQGLRQLPRLHMVLRILQALLLNPHVQLEPYLHLLMPPLLTCCLAKSLGCSPTADHWALRDSSAALVARLCNRFGEPFYGLQVKVSKQLVRALLDGSKPLTSHYGAVVALTALGNTTVRLLLLPQLEPYLVKLRPSLGGDGGGAGAAASGAGRPGEGLRQYEATRVYGALLAAAGSAMYDKLLGTAADGLLPVHLFRGGRSRRHLPEEETPPAATATPATAASVSQSAAAANANGDAIAAAAANANASQGAAAVAVAAAPAGGPPPNPELDALWESIRTSTSYFHDIFNTIVANPSSPESVAQLIQLRLVATLPNPDAASAAMAILHQLAKQGIGLTAANGLPAALAANGLVAAASGPTVNGGPVGHGEAANGKRQKATRSQAMAPPGDKTAAGKGSQASSAGEKGGGGRHHRRSPRVILADSWREDADLGEVVWALTELFGPAFLARLPQPPALTSLML